jgi:uncharacterized protein YjiS (DUF1127 family)
MHARSSLDHYARITEMSRQAREDLASVADYRAIGRRAMNSARFAPAASAAGPRGFAALAQWCLRLVALWRQYRELRTAEREFAALDARALRDLGLHRSEFGSYWAESRGGAQPTRRRVRAGAPA